ncbi:MAG: hypothetical protein EPO39_06140 [Candidatus Manganitrophaceae bacterium]|nr:MAG: hypothetical protein EPO39_06140 [Candidatus Manganitrophaceae bacterium]
MIHSIRLLPRRKVIDLLACSLLIVFLGGCASLKDTRGPRAQIQISNPFSGSGLELHPPVLKIEPGETVAWSNHTTYDLQIRIEPDTASSDAPFFISPLTTVEKKFEEAGTYSYTLFFSSDKTFGNVTGTIVVGDRSPASPPAEKQRPESPPREKTPETEPFII